MDMLGEDEQEPIQAAAQAEQPTLEAAPQVPGQEGDQAPAQNPQDAAQVPEPVVDIERSECWRFYAVPTARVIFTAKTSFDVFCLSREQVWIFSVLGD